MSDASVAVQTALYELLSGTLSVEVLDYVPQDSDHPFVVIGEGSEFPDNTKTKNGVEHRIDIHVYSSKRGKKEVKQIMGQIYAAIHRKALSVTGFETTYPQFDSEITFPEPDGERAVIRFRLTTQPE